MNNIEQTTFPRPWNQERFPVVIGIELPAERLTEFEQRAADQRSISVLDHDLCGYGELVVHVACANADVGRWLRHLWSN